MFVAEIAPAAPLLPPLLTLLGCVVALGVAYSAHAIVSALFAVTKDAVQIAIGWVPWLGKKVVGGVVRTEQRLNNYLAGQVAALETAVAESWHNLAHAVVLTGRALEATAAAVWRVAWYVEVKFPLKVISYLAHEGVKGARAILKRIEAQTVRVQTVVRVIEHPLSGPIAAGVKAGTRAIVGELSALERWIGSEGRVAYHDATVTLPHDIAGLRARDLSLSRLYERLRAWVKRHDTLLGAGALTAAVAYALARLGGTWIRCSNWRKIGKAGCNLPIGLLEDLLALSLAFELIDNPEVLARETVALVDEFSGLIERYATS